MPVLVARSDPSEGPASERSLARRLLPSSPLSDHQLGRLQTRLERAVARARRRGSPVLAVCTVELQGGVDPSAVICGSRRALEPWFAFEQPDRGQTALAGLGEAICLQAWGPERFQSVADRWRRLAADAVCDLPGDPNGSAPIAMGGFSFAPHGGAAPAWDGFEPASLVVPELALARGPGLGVHPLGYRQADVAPIEETGGATVRLTLSAFAGPDDTPSGLLEALTARLAELRMPDLPLLDPDPAGRFQVASVMPPEHYEAAVARAVEIIGRGDLQKVVLAREVEVRAPRRHDPAAMLGVLREAFGSCFVFCVGRGDATLIAASPELLVRREGQRVSTLALAGSTRRSADPAVDDHLGEQLLRSTKDRQEQAIVTRRIERALREHSVWVTATAEPTLVKVANIQHLATPIRAQLAQPLEAIELLELLHPTPALGGEPRELALDLIPALEGLDRGWYGGPVGWVDGTGDGEFCVALRCALLRGGQARCYAGVGVVADSQPAAELAETEIKLAALLPLLSG